MAPIKLDPFCIVCGEPSFQIKVERFRGGAFKDGRTCGFVLCDNCTLRKAEIQAGIIKKNLHTSTVIGLRPEHFAVRPPVEKGGVL